MEVKDQLKVEAVLSPSRRLHGPQPPWYCLWK